MAAPGLFDPGSDPAIHRSIVMAGLDPAIHALRRSGHRRHRLIAATRTDQPSLIPSWPGLTRPSTPCGAQNTAAADSLQRLVQINPPRIMIEYEADFPRALPMLYVLFTLNG